MTNDLLDLISFYCDRNPAQDDKPDTEETVRMTLDTNAQKTVSSHVATQFGSASVASNPGLNVHLSLSQL